MNANLAAKVTAVNNANSFANDIAPKLAEAFKPLVGKKIVKADGSLLAKYTDLVPKFPCNGVVTVYRHRSAYRLAWVVKWCATAAGIAHYAEAYVYVGELKGDILTKIDEPDNLPHAYTVEKIEKARADYKVAKAAAEAALANLHPFGEYDR